MEERYGKLFGLRPGEQKMCVFQGIEHSFGRISRGTPGHGRTAESNLSELNYESVTRTHACCPSPREFLPNCRSCLKSHPLLEMPSSRRTKELGSQSPIATSPLFQRWPADGQHLHVGCDENTCFCCLVGYFLVASVSANKALQSCFVIFEALAMLQVWAYDGICRHGCRSLAIVASAAAQ